MRLFSNNLLRMICHLTGIASGKTALSASTTLTVLLSITQHIFLVKKYVLPAPNYLIKNAEYQQQKSEQL